MNLKLDKINKYKLKFLNSIENKNYYKLIYYLQKYSTYTNLNQVGGIHGANIFTNKYKIDNKEELEKMIKIINNLLNAIFGDEIGNEIISEYKKTFDIDNIEYGTIDLNILFTDIFKSIYGETNTETNSTIEKQINNIKKEIIQIIQNNKSDIKTIKDKQPLEIYNSKYTNTNTNTNKYYNPTIISQQKLPKLLYNINELNIDNLEISNQSDKSDKSGSKKSKKKDLQNNLDDSVLKNIIIY